MASEPKRDPRLVLTRPEPVPLRWPAARELGLAGKGRRLLSLAVRPRGRSRQAVLRDAAFKAAGNLTPSFAVDTDGVRVYVDTADQEISRLVYIYGLYDKPLMTLVFSALGQLGGPADLAGRRLLDVGANIGTTTLTATACFGAAGAYAFEPDPVNFRNLTVNVAANDLGGRVDAFELALSDASGTVALERSPWNAGDHRVRIGAAVDGDAPAAGAREEVEVRAATLDDLVVDGSVDLDEVGIAWIDVQGHEGHVLAGAARLLERGTPLVLEYWPSGLRESGGRERLLELLADAYREFVDLGAPSRPPGGRIRPASEIAALDDELTGPDDHADLLLFNS